MKVQLVIKLSIVIEVNKVFIIYLSMDLKKRKIRYDSNLNKYIFNSPSSVERGTNCLLN